ncbi:putative aminoglycoside phosphotransferase protein (Antibiotic resistance protein) [Vibrio nigripulchritudo MADA3029]|uniref:aminoglycoside phosphotransferase family protein n=1 Tax=Vibrio nigripulchritudo TaxID=28173 RepID=UPI0003B1DF73|nr:aminoglycoside phosphotransferase family protein [Vibrio nigripulchritudo]CCN47355.1 putative aminoglycoside phosphotransferase protein (Antibiotic resistance protein) [Vibrio nigripulchritudo MADA3020]CCN55220.1 putative aminoglycoside phosphotransferase protein (Antibiotic resistance protein) [Vibrio nigripulchritudo MADA3021]CCN60999.1 putative aminoglycoside phosphotransferase protein (Antibiotic resistance protein) [Vibrio nigripulchritudo MADA3029]
MTEENKVQFEQECKNIMVELGLAQLSEIRKIQPLTGGVSSDIALVETSRGKYCVKCSLEQLRVTQNWQAPTHRNQTEYQWLSYVAGFMPQSVPTLYGQSQSGNGFAMEFCPPDRFINWKDELMAGKVDIEFAASVGQCLGEIHQRSAVDKPDFPNQDDFYSLRLSPYLESLEALYPEYAATINGIRQSLYESRLVLVHGDVSPKNILKGPNGPMLLDAECAVTSDPAFDVAFCLNHLINKWLMGIADRDALKRSIEQLWLHYAAFVQWESLASLESRICALLPCLILARADGKSPLEYHTDTSKVTARRVAHSLFNLSFTQLKDVLEHIEAEFITNHESR